MKIVFTDGRFICLCSFEDRIFPQRAGFRWHNEARVWYTTKHGVAAKLLNHCDETAKKEISRKRLHVETWTHGLAIPKTERLYQFQESAALFALARNQSYLGLDPGLGKTPIASVVAGTLSQIEPFAFVYICPPFLTRNTEAEFKRWAPSLKVTRLDSMKAVGTRYDVLIVPDSVVTRDGVQATIRAFIKGRKSRLFVDEAHRFKNETAGRTKALLGDSLSRGIANGFDQITYMSGTPMPNRPMELFSILSHSSSEAIHDMTRFEYGRKFCAGHRNQFGWDFSGASNIKQLVAQVTDKFMLRMRKAEVLTELPPKTEEMIFIGEDLTPSLSKLDSQILEAVDPEDLMKGRLAADLGVEELHLMTYRKELGIAKVKEAANYIRYILEESNESLLVFGIHKDAIAHLNKELEKFDPLVITGDTPMGDRHEIVKTFQTDRSRRLFIGNIQAAGTGLTLTKATRVIFAEFSWVPADNDQASDRAHRIGQRDNVFVQYLVFKNSIDRVVLETILKKRKVVDQL